MDWRRLLFVLVSPALISACSKTDPRSVQPPAAVPNAVASASPAKASYRHTATGRIVAIGDLHGDVDAAKAALRLGGAIDKAGTWIGGPLVVVQLGDEIDRGDYDREVIDLFEDLKSEAASAGGAVYPLNGNHELMNAMGDFFYTTEGGFAGFAGADDGSVPEAVLSRFAPAQRQRAAAFSPGGPYARKLATRDVVVVVNDTVFVHGALLPEHVRYGIGRLNRETQAWLRGDLKEPPELTTSHGSPTWQATYSDEKVTAESCGVLGKVLGKVRAQRMVVGHTMQKGGKIHAACGRRIWTVDVGLAKHYGPASTEILEIDGNQVRTLRDPEFKPPS